MEENKFVLEYQKYFDFIIVDECHKLGANKFCNILDNWGDSKFILGLSATPDRQDNKEIIYYPYFDNIIDV